MNHKEQALEAAAAVMAEMDISIPDSIRPLIRTGLAIAWLEGSKAGAEETLEAFHEALAQA